MHGERVRTALLEQTGQLRQICLAWASRPARAGPRSFSGWKNTALSIPRHAPRICQSQTSVTGAGSLRVSAMLVIPSAGAAPIGAASHHNRAKGCSQPETRYSG